MPAASKRLFGRRQSGFARRRQRNRRYRTVLRHLNTSNHRRMHRLAQTTTSYVNHAYLLVGESTATNRDIWTRRPITEKQTYGKEYNTPRCPSCGPAAGEHAGKQACEPELRHGLPGPPALGRRSPASSSALSSCYFRRYSI